MQVRYTEEESRPGMALVHVTMVVIPAGVYLDSPESTLIYYYMTKTEEYSAYNQPKLTLTKQNMYV